MVGIPVHMLEMIITNCSRIGLCDAAAICQLLMLRKQGRTGPFTLAGLARYLGHSVPGVAQVNACAVHMCAKYEIDRFWRGWPSAVPGLGSAPHRRRWGCPTLSARMQQRILPECQNLTTAQIWPFTSSTQSYLSILSEVSSMHH